MKFLVRAALSGQALRPPLLQGSQVVPFCFDSEGFTSAYHGTEVTEEHKGGGETVGSILSATLR